MVMPVTSMKIPPVDEQVGAIHSDDLADPELLNCL
jgi:hypothetical protein